MFSQSTQPCRNCAGTGIAQRIKNEQVHVEVQLEAGMVEGARIRCHGQGNVTITGQGDVVAVVKERKHPIFTRQGRHLVMQHKVPLVEALCGVTFPLKMLDGRRLRVCSSAGGIIRPGSAHVLVGEGMPVHGEPSTRGDLIIAFQVVFPKDGELDQAAVQSLRGALNSSKGSRRSNTRELEGAWDAGEEALLQPFNRETLDLPATANRDRAAYDEDSESMSGRGGLGSFFNLFRSRM